MSYGYDKGHEDLYVPVTYNRINRHVTINELLIFRFFTNKIIWKEVEYINKC